MLRQRQKSWILDLGLLALLCLALLAPALFAGKPTFVHDVIHNEMPHLLRLAKELRAGGPPLWNQYLFAGARPTIYESYWLYYLPGWPFLMLSDVNDPAAFARTALLLPYLLHMILAAAGTYVFLRHTLTSRRLGALAGGVLFALGPAFSTSIENLSHVALIAWLPWLAVAGTAFLKRGGARRWAAVLLALVAINSAGVMNTLVRLYPVTGLLFFLVWLGLGARLGSWPARFGRLAGLAGAYVLAAGILGPLWGGAYEAKSVVESAVAELAVSTSMVVQTSAAEGHTPVLHFASMFCPDLFGVVSLHGWGVAIDHPVTLLGHVGGGVAVMSVIFYGLIRLFRGGSETDPVARAWWRASAGVCVLVIILMMGKHTFLHAPLSLLGGFLVSGPHPYYYQFAPCWLLAVLAGLGIGELAAIDQRGRRATLAALAAGCGLVAVAAALVSLLSPMRMEDLGPKTTALVEALSPQHARLLWVHAMQNSGGLRWLLAGPGIYVLLSVLGCAAAARFCPARRLPLLALAVILIECGVFSGTVLYVSTNTWQNELDFSRRGNQQPKLAHVADLPHFELAAAASAAAEEGSCRWTMAWSRGDNLAQCFGTRALMGHASRPLIKEFHEAARQVYSGFPYQLKIQAKNDRELTNFLENENVGFLLSASGQRLIRFKPVPAIHRHTVVQEMDEAGQLEATVSRSFAEACLVLPGTGLKWVRPSGTVKTEARQSLALHGPGETPENPPMEAETPSRQTGDDYSLGRPVAQQDAGTPVPVPWSRPHADRIEVSSHGATAAMTVITECWHPGWQATVDGEAAPVHKVNHHQMAVEVPPGDHEITLRFRPRCITVGLWISLASMIAALGTCVAMKLFHGDKR